MKLELFFCRTGHVFRNSNVPKKFCQFFPVVFYGIIGANIINIAVVTMKNAVRVWSPAKAEKVN